jgi:acetyl esterase/lipase
LSPEMRTVNLYLYSTKTYVNSIQEFQQQLDSQKNLFPPMNTRYYDRMDVNNGSIYLVVREKQCKRLVLYVHGGGFVAGDPSIPARVLSNEFVQHEKSQCIDMLFVKYRLCPGNTLEHALQDIQKAYKYVSQLNKYTHITVMGDSAGGTLSTLFIMSTYIQSIFETSKIDSLVLLSPALDLTFSSESMNNNVGRDVFVTDNVINLVKTHVLENDEHYAERMSPLQKLKQDPTIKLPRVFLSYSESERLSDECEEFFKLLKNDNDQRESQWGVQHVYQLFPSYIPEVSKVITNIISFIVKSS